MARPGRPSGMRPDISSGDRCPSRMGLTASGRLPGPSMGLGRLKRSLLLSAFLCAADARQRRPAGPCQPFRPISRDMAGLSLWSSLAIWLAPSWPFQRTMMSSRSAMPRWLQSSMAPPTMHASAGIIIGRAWAAISQYPVALGARIRRELLPFGRFWAVRSLFRSILSWLLRRLAGTDYVRLIKSRSEITSSQPQKELLPLADAA